MKTERLPWFKCDPAKLLGALASMEASEGYVYCVVILRIYESGGACRDTLEALATRTRLKKKVVLDALDNLFKAGRLYREGDSGIMNPVAAKVLSETTAFREKQIEAGKKGGISAAEKRKQNQQMTPSKPTVPLVAKPSHLDLEEKKEKEGSKKERKNPRAARSVLALDWATSESDLEFAAKNGFDARAAKSIAHSFADHHRSRGSLMADWSAAWRTWIRNEIKFNRRGPPSPNGPQSRTPFPSRNGAAALLFDQLTSGDEDARNAPRTING